MCHRHDTENDNKNEQNNNRKAKNKGSFGRYVPSNRFISLLYDFFKFFIYRLDLLVSASDVGRSLSTNLRVLYTLSISMSTNFIL